ncbi:MAG: glycosyltransferase [Thermodesulfobacteriota bacterium]|nr:glycosyltransferase [Thermodesulfobacteriota bacterium]
MTCSAPRRRVLILISSLVHGGAEKQTIDLINNIQDRSLELGLCFFGRNDDLVGFLARDRLSEFKCLDKKAFFDFRMLRKLLAVIRRFQPDVILCVNPYPGLYARAARILSGKNYKIVQSIHSTFSENQKHDLCVRVLYRYTINSSDVVVFVSQNQKRHWVDHYRVSDTKSTHIYNGVDLEAYKSNFSGRDRQRLLSQIGFSSRHIVLGLCATLRALKRHTDLIGAGKILRDRGYDVKLLFIGDGEERQRIEQYARDKGMGHHLAMTGFQKDVRPYVELADIMVLPSRTEAFPMSIIESMALGKPIVATNVGGIPEQVVHGENGYLYPPGDVYALAKYLEMIIREDTAEPMGERSRRLAEKNFSMEGMVFAYKQLLHNQLTDKG